MTTFLKTVFCLRSIYYSALDFNGFRTLRFVVSEAVYFSFQKGGPTCDDSCVLNYSSTFLVTLKLNKKGTDFLHGHLKYFCTSKYKFSYASEFKGDTLIS